jgi:hypothetical protein
LTLSIRRLNAVRTFRGGTPIGSETGRCTGRKIVRKLVLRSERKGTDSSKTYGGAAQCRELAISSAARENPVEGNASATSPFGILTTNALPFRYAVRPLPKVLGRK